MIEGSLKDLQLALRRVRRAPLFSGAVMLILGIGVGANTTTLSVVNAFIWRPVSVPNPEQLVAIATLTKEGQRRSTPLPLIDVLARSGLPVDGLCGYSTGLAATDANARSARSTLLLVAGDCSTVFQVQPLFGRLIGRDDAPLQGKGGAVAMLSHAYWQQAFDGDTDVVGKTVRIDDTVVTVVGVLPQHFTGIDKDLDSELVVPFNSYRTSSGAIHLLGRLRDGTSMAQLESRLHAVWTTAFDAALPAGATAADRLAASGVQPELRSATVGFSTLRNLYGATFANIAALTALLALLTSINVGGLLCSRMASKVTELGILRALGASRARIVRAMLMEALLLALGGCVLGLPLAYAAAPTFVALLPVGNLPWTISLQPDGRVVAAAVGTAFLIALVITAIPAWLATRRGSLQMGTDRSVTRATNRWAQALLVLQVAATLVLVFGCSLLVRSLVALETTDRGYGARDVLSVRLTSTAGGYTTLNQPAYYPDLVSRVAALPGVRSVGMARYFGTVPNERGWYGPVSWSGQDPELTTAIYEYASPGFFRTVGIPLLRGRDFSWSDRPDSAPVVLVSDSLARVLDPTGDVVGRFLRYGKEPSRQKLQIVGVVGNTSFGNSRSREIRTVYFPGIQVKEATFGTLHIATSGDLAAISRPVREILASLGHEQVVVASTIDGMFDNWLVAERMGATVSTAVTLLALGIACVGVYALLSYAVSRRAREIGIRMAVGASGRDVFGLVLRDAGRIAGAGVALGLPAALVSTRVLDSLVFGVTTSDPITLVASAALLVAIALIAAAIPAWRAVRVDPTIALRAD